MLSGIVSASGTIESTPADQSQGDPAASWLQEHYQLFLAQGKLKSGDNPQLISSLFGIHKIIRFSKDTDLPFDA